MFFGRIWKIFLFPDFVASYQIETVFVKQREVADIK